MEVIQPLEVDLGSDMQLRSFAKQRKAQLAAELEQLRANLE